MQHGCEPWPQAKAVPRRFEGDQRITRQMDHEGRRRDLAEERTQIFVACVRKDIDGRLFPRRGPVLTHCE